MFHLKKSAKSVSGSTTEGLISKHDEIDAKDCAKLTLDSTRWEASRMQSCLDDIAFQSHTQYFVEASKNWTQSQKP